MTAKPPTYRACYPAWRQVWQPTRNMLPRSSRRSNRFNSSFSRWNPIGPRSCKPPRQPTNKPWQRWGRPIAAIGLGPAPPLFLGCSHSVPPGGGGRAPPAQNKRPGAQSPVPLVWFCGQALAAKRRRPPGRHPERRCGMEKRRLSQAKEQPRPATKKQAQPFRYPANVPWPKPAMAYTFFSLKERRPAP